MLRLELFVEDIDASLAFYTEVLGFEEIETGTTGTYRPLRRGGARISVQHVSTLPPDHPRVVYDHPGLGVEIVLEVEDVEALYRHVKDRWPLADELMDRPWGLTDFRVFDPDGYYWRPTNS